MEGVEGESGGREWRERVEGESGGREWREGVEGESGGREWRERVEGGSGGREWREEESKPIQAYAYSARYQEDILVGGITKKWRKGGFSGKVPSAMTPGSMLTTTCTN